ncbi:MAG TPA: amidohydrolase family protein [Acetobacteraceae bacterium]|nr:amidohydrolase family protein [Acetobacteraceae bacterium]
MSELPTIDPHHHLWDMERFSYPWLVVKPQPISVAGDVAPIAHSYRIEDYLADIRDQNVVKSVHIDAGYDQTDPVGETRWLQSVADAHGFPHGIVAHAQLQASDVQAVLEGHRQFRNLRGIRHIVNWHRDPAKTFVQRPDLLTDPAWLAGFRLLRRYDLSFDLQLYPSQMLDGAKLAAAHADTSIILNHAGMPIDRDPEGIAQWRSGMRALAAQPNVTAKVSGLGMVDWHWTVESIRPFVLEAIEIFGPARAMFASNFPVDKLYSSFDALYGAFRAIVRDFSEDEKRMLFAGTAERVYRI